MRKKSLILLLGFVLMATAMTVSICIFGNNDGSVIFYHEKLYEQYKNKHPEMGNWQVLTVPVDEKEPEIFAETEYFSLYLENRNTNRGKLYLNHEFKQKETYSFESPDLCSFTAFDSEGNQIASLIAGTKSGYYNPYTEEWEPCVWTEKNDGKEIVLKILAVENIFVSEKVLPNVISEEDFEELAAIAESQNEANVLNNWYLKYDPEKDMGQIVPFLGLGSSLDEKTIAKGVYAWRNTEARHEGEADDAALDWGLTTKQKRVYEKNVLGNIKAISAMVTVTINIEGEYPVFNIEHEMISPKNSKVAKIDFNIWGTEILNQFYAGTYEK